MSEYEVSSQNQVRRAPKRGHYDHETVHRVLDQSLLGHVGFAGETGPVVIPMLFARLGNALLFHGATKSRLMKQLTSGTEICISVAIVDGLVLAKSLFHHSMNYRSVTVFGKGIEVTDEHERMNALKIISDKVMPERWHDARLPNPQEMKATCVAAIEIDSASAKIRVGDPVEDKDDLNLPVWSGVVPFIQHANPPIPARDDKHSIALPEYLSAWRTKHNESLHLNKESLS